MATIYNLFVINKSGGLIFYKVPERFSFPKTPFIFACIAWLDCRMWLSMSKVLDCGFKRTFVGREWKCEFGESWMYHGMSVEQFLGWMNKLQDYGSTGRLDTNDSLRLASLWHSMHAISIQLSPTAGCTGIEVLEADTFDLHCFQSLTGLPRLLHFFHHWTLITLCFSKSCFFRFIYLSTLQFQLKSSQVTKIPL